VEAGPRTDGERLPSGIDFEALARDLRPLGSTVRLRLLDLLTEPLYLEEVARRIGLSRQGVRRHLDELVEVGLLRKQLGDRPVGEVSEYVLDHARVFQMNTEFARLGMLRPTREALAHAPTADVGRSGKPARAAARGEPALALVRGQGEGRVFLLAHQPGRVWRIGRAKGAEIRLDYDPYVSNRHAEVRREAAGFALVDAFSRNGTTLNWAPIEKGEAAPLARGDVIGVGRTLLVFQERQS
jgi:DNA-binding transcriptional ArsR family regulator